jgi:phosphoserine phosphatase
MDDSKVKIVYFVRHGESIGNIGKIYQSSDMPLSDRGKEQAKAIAERASKIDFQKLISSPYERTKETALEVSKLTNKEIEFSDLFIEWIRPDSVGGKPHDDEETKLLVKKISASVFNGGEKVPGAEDFEALIGRARSALDFLLNLPEEKILVVTHGLFIKMMVFSVILGDQISPAVIKNMDETMSVKNTGLTILKYKKTNSDPVVKWRLIAYNDHAHLG